MMRDIGDERPLPFAQAGAGFHEMDAGVEGDAGHGAQRVGRQRAAAGAKLHIMGRRAAAGPHPYVRQAEADQRSEEHTSELQSLMRISYAVFCLKKKK